MSIDNKLITLTENLPKIFDAGFKFQEKYSLPLYYLSFKDFQWYKVEFPQNFELFLKTAKTPYTCNAMFSNTTGIKSITLECEDKSGSSRMSQAFRESSDLELIDLRNFNLKMNDISYFTYGSKKLVSILGAIDLSNCASATSAFVSTPSLRNLEFVKNTIKVALDFSWCTNLSHESLISILNGLYNFSFEIDLANFRPDYSPKNDSLVPGVYKITNSEIFVEANGNQYISITTEPGYMFRVYDFDCKENWSAVKEGAIVGNYVDFTGEYDSDDNFEFDSLYIKSNPDNIVYTLTVGAGNLNKLTEEEKQIATNKGWVLK